MQGKTVLVVDDDPDTLHAYAALLEHDGFQVRTARNGGEAIMEVHRDGPDLIVMDLMMPVVGGLEAAESLRGYQKTASIPIIAVTGSQGTPEQERMRRYCDELLIKPCPPETLLERVRRYTG
jgi:CheY-like chemotaxis protein